MAGRRVSASLTKPLLGPGRTVQAHARGANARLEATPSSNIDDGVRKNHFPGTPLNAKIVPLVSDAKLMTGIEATFAMVSFLMNVAQFTLPFCFVRVGWFAVFLMVLAGWLCMHTALMLQEALVALTKEGIRFPEYSDLAAVAVGPVFAAWAQLVALAELAAYGSNCTINLGYALAAMFPISQNTAIGAACALCVALSAFSDRLFAYVGLLSSVATVVILGLLLCGGPDSWATDMLYLPDPDYIPSTFALIFFAVGTHPLIVGVMHTTRSPTDLRVSILGAWPIATTVSVLCGGMAYRIYGSALQPDIMANIEGELRRIAGVWMAIKVLGNAVPLARPLANAYARSLRWLPPGHSAGPLLMTPVMVLLAAVAIFFADRLEAFYSVAGCTITSFNVLLIPTIAYLSICKPRGISHYCAVGYAILGAVLSVSPVAYLLWQLACPQEDPSDL
mmetsp:Transcript_94370/g.224784  ORF Transcript_94370/g.224784 Transcript_94370/m.224784 type:complete len:449 (+) Transcript_94370:37-1383(+)